ncbi:AAA family ATPase [Kibdelosporangium phytohabitans]|uniref:AAA family ATPase n=1 Tax=Kibdelosporangium phytohabitans TaxID=860235 RepID=UPI0007C8124C|nr:ATP-binding protein [Kibdelosporangium phytohabitans]MBE1462644.1 putative kinase [Kibdelosporangium phytohabitans]
MIDPAPTVYLLAGLPGSGKTTYANTLRRRGVVRLSVDEQVIAAHGRLGKDYPETEHLALLRPITDAVRRQLATLVQNGQSVVLDHGLGTKAERDAYKDLVTRHGGRWRLIHFPVARAELLRRLAVRNDDAESGLISPEVLDWIAEHSEEPVGEGEELPDSDLRPDC